jgi:hypothetical protein
MGWCSEFGIEIRPRCDHAMLPVSEACQCEECGALCPGRFDGCPAVWERGPLPDVALRRAPRPVPRGGGHDHRPDGRAVEAISWLAAEDGGAAAKGNGRNGQPRESATLRDGLVALRTKLGALRSALEEAKRTQAAPKQVVRLAEQLPYRVAVSVANAVQAGEAGRLEQVAEAVALMDETIQALRLGPAHDAEAGG